MDPYVIVSKPTAAVYGEPELENRTDEALCGNVCRVLAEEPDCLYIISSYGYAGFIRREDVLLAEEPEMRSWLNGTSVIDGTCVDVLTKPVVKGMLKMTLPRGALVKPAGDAEGGYTRVILADGTTGYVASNRLMEKRFGEELLSEDPGALIQLQKDAVSKREKETGGRDGFDFRQVLDQWYGDGSGSYEEKEAAFRKELVKTAGKYLGVQYRWGGRSSFGIDCSGLLHMSYLLCGVHIFRDAAIVKDYPLKRLELVREVRDMPGSAVYGSIDGCKPGDVLYFPDHVAMYLGDSLYIHSTGKAGDMGVVINSLDPGHELYREDLPEKLYAAAGLRL